MSEFNNIKHNKERIDQEYWIDRQGKIHKYTGDLNADIISMHSEIAHRFYPESNRPKDILMNLGWVMIGSVVYTIPIIHKKPTQSQLNTLNDLGLYKRLHFLHNGSYINFEKYQILCQ